MFTEIAQINIRCSRCGKLHCVDARFTPDGVVQNSILKEAGLERITLLLIRSDKINDQEIRRSKDHTRFTGTLCGDCRVEAGKAIQVCRDILRKVIHENYSAHGLQSLISKEMGELLMKDTKRGAD